MTFIKAKDLAVRLAKLNKQAYAIWLSQTRYRRGDGKLFDDFTVQPYKSYDQYRDGFIQFISAK